MAQLFKSVMFQLTRGIQVFLQRQDRKTPETSYWRPFLMTVSSNSFERFNALTMTSWISFKYGFGNYTHLQIGDLTKENIDNSKEAKARLIDLAGGIKNRVFLDTYLASSEEESIRYSVQTPSSS